MDTPTATKTSIPKPVLCWHFLPLLVNLFSRQSITRHAVEYLYPSRHPPPHLHFSLRTVPCQRHSGCLPIPLCFKPSCFYFDSSSPVLSFFLCVLLSHRLFPSLRICSWLNTSIIPFPQCLTPLYNRDTDAFHLYSTTPSSSTTLISGLLPCRWHCGSSFHGPLCTFDNRLIRQTKQLVNRHQGSTFSLLTSSQPALLGQCERETTCKAGTRKGFFPLGSVHQSVCGKFT